MATRGVTVNVQPSVIPKGMSHLSQQYFFDYFSVKYLQRKHHDKLCAVTQWLRWDADKKHLDIPIKQLKKCLTSGKRFVFQTSELSSRVGGAHANAIVFDTHPDKKICWRMDPQGAVAMTAFKDFKYELLDNKLSHIFESMGYRYMPPNLFCPYLGPQHFEEGSKVSGYCASFSVYFVDMQLTYPDMHIGELVYHINMKMMELRKKKLSFEKYILQFAQQIYNLMWEEFPQYKDFFIHYDKYAKQRNNKEFKKFEEFMHRLLMKDDD